MPYLRWSPFQLMSGFSTTQFERAQNMSVLVEKGESIEYIAKKYKLSRACVTNWIMKYKVHIRDRDCKDAFVYISQRQHSVLAKLTNTEDIVKGISVDDVLKLSTAQLLREPNFGRKSLLALVLALDSLGIDNHFANDLYRKDRDIRKYGKVMDSLPADRDDRCEELHKALVAAIGVYEYASMTAYENEACKEDMEYAQSIADKYQDRYGEES